jgi:hypothetical protein
MKSKFFLTLGLSTLLAVPTFAQEGDPATETERILHEANLTIGNAFQEASAAYNQAVAFVVGSSLMPNEIAKTRISLDVRDKSLRDILKQLADAAKMDVAFDEDLPGELYSFTFKNAYLDDALRLVTHSAGIGYSLERKGDKKTLHFGKKRSTPSALPVLGSWEPQMSRATARLNSPVLGSYSHALPEITVDVNFRNTDVDDAFRSVLNQAGVGYVLGNLPKEPKVTLDAKGANLGTILDQIAKAAGVSWHWVAKNKDGKRDKNSGTVVVSKSYNTAFRYGQSYISLLDATGHSVRSGFTFTTGNVADKTEVFDKDYDVTFRDTSLRDALQDVLKRSGVKYLISSDLPDTKIHLEAKNATLRALLDALCAEGGTRWQQEVDVTEKNGKQEVEVTIQVGGRTRRTFNGSTPVVLGVPGVNRTITNLVTERRHTFVCPHCRGKVSVLGEERPPWKNCPLCGKGLPKKKSESFFSNGEGEDALPSFFSFSG